MEIKIEGVESIEVNTMYTPFAENSMDKYGRKLAGALVKKIAYNFDTNTWVNFKIFGLMIITFLFIIVIFNISSY